MSSYPFKLTYLLWMIALLLAGSVTLAQAGPVAQRYSAEHPGHAMDPQWSPDGKTLAYEVSYSQEKYTELYLRHSSGTEEKLRPPAGASALGGRFAQRRQVAHEFAWSPKGQLYAFSSSGSDDDFDVYLRGVSVAIGGEHKEGAVAFSSSGRLLSYCSAASGDGDLYLLDIYALEEPPRRLTFSPGLDFYGVWSPSAETLAYVEHSEGGTNIKIIDDIAAPQASTRAVTDWNSNQLKPSWSPNGLWISFYSNHKKDDRSRFDAYVVQASGGKPFVVASDVLPSERRGPTWSPDGKELILVKNDPNQGDPLVRVAVASQQSTLIPTGTVNNAEPTVVVDEAAGTWQLAFVSQGLAGSDQNSWRGVWTYDLPRKIAP